MNFCVIVYQNCKPQVDFWQQSREIQDCLQEVYLGLNTRKKKITELKGHFSSLTIPSLPASTCIDNKTQTLCPNLSSLSRRNRGFETRSKPNVTT
jgi:hypothetical protein